MYHFVREGDHFVQEGDHFVQEGDPGIVIAYADAQSVHNVLGLHQLQI